MIARLNGRNPDGVVGLVARLTQGSRAAATPGWRSKSRWDLPTRRQHAAPKSPSASTSGRFEVEDFVKHISAGADSSSRQAAKAPSPHTMCQNPVFAPETATTPLSPCLLQDDRLAFARAASVVDVRNVSRGHRPIEEFYFVYFSDEVRVSRAG